MKMIKDPVLFDKIREFLTEHMPILREKSSNTIIAYRYTLNIYMEFLQKSQLKALSDITLKDFNQKNILNFTDWLISERSNKAFSANLRLTHMKKFCRFLMEENILMLSELSAIRKIGKISDIKTDEIVFLTIEETKLLLSQPNLSKEIGTRDSFLCICFMTAAVVFRKCWI